ncbi:HAMP domain-containing methyl-accepting chemotaxis protein [Vibrio pectenicida]|uniref:Methyl-accepting chemotaxis protein n=1 Tax=Vibrio pectenicida TaxID=62763 RepID=A0A3R9F7B7_9VIBR|nr:methyl-accepting chemotaxis protein [Vibrio pectenicida]RSD30581.1 methyl-accepting chemotaxis protein [Vibrio pectenicida]
MHFLYNLKMSFKLAGAFGLLVIMTAVVTLNGMVGVSRLNSEVEIADDFNRIVKYTSEIRIAEKNFALRNDEAYVTEIKELISMSNGLASDIQARVSEPTVGDLLNQVVDSLNTYQTALDQYVSQKRQQASAGEDMRKYARQVDEIVANIRIIEKQEVEQLFQFNAPAEDILTSIRIADDANRMIKWMLEARRAEKNFILSGDEKAIKDVRDTLSDMYLLMKSFPEDTPKLKDLESAILLYQQAFDNYLEVNEQSIETNKLMLTEAREVESFTSEARKIGKEMLKEFEESLRVTNLLIAFVAILLGVGVSILMTKMTVPPLKRAVKVSQRIASGDLGVTIEVNRSDEIGELLRAIAAMTEQLRDMIGNLSTNIESIADSSDDLSSLTTKTSDGVGKQKQDIDQVATAMTEMSSSAHEVAQKANTTSDAANLANSQTVKGNELISTTVDGMSELAVAIGQSQEVIQRVKGDSENIATILDVIKNISDQTNLLALNAAIEAARAGDHGRGFAVVADEVRSLAQKTQESTVEIEKMIEVLKSGAESAVAEMVKSKQQVDGMVSQTEQVKKSLSSISNEVSTITEMNAQIAQAVNEQGKVAEDVSQRMNTISDVADQTAQASDQTSESSRNLARVGEELKRLSSFFKM